MKDKNKSINMNSAMKSKLPSIVPFFLLIIYTFMACSKTPKQSPTVGLDTSVVSGKIFSVSSTVVSPAPPVVPGE
jgi:hypothetical protein